MLLSLGIAVLNGVVVRGAMSVLNKTFSSVNDELDPNLPAPTTALRSGGPGSLASWASLGHQGRIFLHGGPTVAQLSDFNKAPATEPIRAYAGLNSANGIRATAEMAADELERQGGLKRKIIGVATTTGTGWINAAEADSLEYMYNGDTAIVSMQYSYLPSWLSFLVDKENARQAGQALFEAVDEKVRALPEAQRPKIVVFGESLGSFGGEAPFLAPNNIIARTERGAVLRSDVREHHARQRHRQPRPGLAGVAADLRRRRQRPLRRPRRRTSAGRTSRGASRGSPTCSTPPTRSPGGHRNCFSPNRIGCANRAGTTSPRT